jgi:hypothetical protein
VYGKGSSKGPVEVWINEKKVANTSHVINDDIVSAIPVVRGLPNEVEKSSCSFNLVQSKLLCQQSQPLTCHLIRRKLCEGMKPLLKLSQCADMISWKVMEL